MMRTWMLSVLFIAVSCGRRHADGPMSCGDYTADTTPIKGPPVGQSGNDHDNPFRSLAIDPNNPQVLYVGSEGNGLFRSIDGGNTWQWLRNGIYHCDGYPEVYSIAIDPNNTAHLMMATNSGPGPAGSHGGGLYMSSDSGYHWTVVNNGIPTSDGNSVIISPLSSQNFFAGMAGGGSTNSNNRGQLFVGGVFSSADGGQSWQPLYNTTPANINNWWEMEVRRSAGAFTLYGLGAISSTGTAPPSGFFKATQNGMNWIKLFGDSVLGSPFNGSMFDVSADQQYIYIDNYSYGIPLKTIRSNDGGATWVQTAQAGNGPIRIVGAGPNSVVFSAYNNIYHSSDGMNTATLAFDGYSLHLDNDVTDIEVAPSNNNIVYAVAKGLHVYKSTNGGVGFTEVANLRNYINAH